MNDASIIQTTYTQLRVFEVDETYDWISKKLVKAAGIIFTVYLYDASYVTYLCEPTPCY